MNSPKFPSPPRLAVWLVKRLERYRTNHAITDDMREVFTRMYRERGFIVACIWYWSQGLDAVIKDILFNSQWRFIMLKNYIKIAFRNINKQKVYSFINISGLTIGFTCFILIFLFIQYELSCDRFHENSKRIYRVIHKMTKNDETASSKSASSQPALVPTLLDEFQEVESATRVGRYIMGSINIKSDVFFIKKWVWADKRIFDVFTLPLINGEPKTALERPFSVVIDEETAQKYFGNESPVGKTLQFAIAYSPKKYTYQITGVMKNIPAKSHFKPHFIGSFETQRSLGYPLDWEGPPFHSYILLHKNSDYHELENKIQTYIERNIIPISRRKNWTYTLQPLTDIHLRSTDIQNNFEQGGDIKYVYICSVLAFFIILIACVNYINLSTARGIRRSREVCIRKVVGANRSQLIKQFLGESMILTLASLMMAIVFVYVFIGPFATFVGRDIKIHSIANPGIILVLIGTGLLVGILSGFYPAVFLSRFSPITILKGVIGQKIKKINLRNGLVVFQFSISIFLIFSTLIISGQLNYIHNKKLGYERKHVVVVDLPFNTGSQIQDTARNELMQIHGIKGVTFSLTLPILMDWNARMDYQGRQSDELFETNYCDVDHSFIDVFNMEIIEGRNFSREITSDLSGGGSYILNETAAKQLGWDEPIGEKIGQGPDEMGQVIGIVKDFNSRSLYEPHKPVVLKLAPGGYIFRSRFMAVKISTENITGTIEAVEKLWKKLVRIYPFEYYFLDNAYDNMYKSEIRFGTIFKYFTLLAIFISCFGLFGLVSFTAEQSRKEISIRRILGASTQNIFMFLSWKFIKWVIIANLIALPIGYYLMHKWLQDFAFRIDLSFFMFFYAFVLAFFIALCTISIQSIKAATANPADSLRHE